jgi:hypothetical protein
MDWTERMVWMVLLAWMVWREIVDRRANRAFLEDMVSKVSKVRAVNRESLEILKNAAASNSATTTKSSTTQETRTTP